jgi:hypothetical protein
MLGPILAVTISVPNLAIIENSYTQVLAYQVVERGIINSELISSWDAPATSGRPYILMQPESRQNFFLRFIESPTSSGEHSLKTLGWNAAELLVKDVDSMPNRLANSSFKIIAMPRTLSTTDEIKAMQAFGPANELLYFTTVNNESFGLGRAESDVDRVFIVINAGAKMSDHINFYAKILKVEVSKPQSVRMSALNAILKLDSEETHPLATAKLGGPFLIELDEYPEGTLARPRLPGDIHSGISIVSFEVESLDDLPVKVHGRVSSPKGRLYSKGRTAIIIGPSGEWLELIEKSK